MKRILLLQNKLVVTTFVLFSILSLTSSCKKSSSDKPGPNEVYIANMAFSPSTLTVTVNTTVTWTNNDGIAHTVTSTTGLFDSGSIASKGTYSYTFTTAGTYSYKCNIHPTMTGTIVVNTASTNNGTGY